MLLSHCICTGHEGLMSRGHINYGSPWINISTLWDIFPIFTPTIIMLAHICSGFSNDENPLSFCHSFTECSLIFTPPPIRGQVISLFISLSARLWENGWANLHEIFSEGVEWPRDDLIKCMVSSGKWVGGSKVNLLSPDIAIWFDCCLLAVLSCHLATENVMKLLFLAFCYIANSQHGGGVCCASHHSLLELFFWHI